MKTLPRIAAVIICLCSVTHVLHAQVPHLINYQGRVLSGGMNFDGSVCSSSPYSRMARATGRKPGAFSLMGSLPSTRPGTGMQVRPVSLPRPERRMRTKFAEDSDEASALRRGSGSAGRRAAGSHRAAARSAARH